MSLLLPPPPLLLLLLLLVVVSAAVGWQRQWEEGVPLPKGPPCRQT
jgi:hypothetical protein